MWRSATSWMPWSKTARLRRMAEQERQRNLMLQQLIPALLAAMEPVLIRHLQQQQQFQRDLLMEAMGPLSLALSRQDQRREETQEETVSLLTEVLNSLQPSPQQTLLNGRSRHLPSSLASAISAER